MNNVFILLVKPQLGQNIGSVARVMKNLNFKNLRIVNPRDGWPNQDVISTVAGADDIIKNTKLRLERYIIAIIPRHTFFRCERIR